MVRKPHGLIVLFLLAAFPGLFLPGFVTVEKYQDASQTDTLADKKPATAQAGIPALKNGGGAFDASMAPHAGNTAARALPNHAKEWYS